jgi:hypothetical protein
MYLIAVKQKDYEEGAYCIRDESGEKVLLFFENCDDAVRYSMQLKDLKSGDITVEEYDDMLLQQVCKVTGYKYTIITENDIVVPRLEINDNL